MRYFKEHSVTTSLIYANQARALNFWDNRQVLWNCMTQGGVWQHEVKGQSHHDLWHITTCKRTPLAAVQWCGQFESHLTTEQVSRPFHTPLPQMTCPPWPWGPWRVLEGGWLLGGNSTVTCRPPYCTAPPLYCICGNYWAIRAALWGRCHYLTATQQIWREWSLSHKTIGSSH